VAQPPFFVLSSTPADGSFGVALDQTIFVVLNKALDVQTVDPTTLEVHSSSGIQMAGTVSIVSNGEDRTLRWTPIHNLALAEEHTVTVADALRSVDDEELSQPARFTFVTTAAGPEDPLPQAGQLRSARGRLNQGRQGHRGTLLLDGRVLITGGFFLGGAATDRAEVFSEDSEEFSLLSAHQVHARAAHSATRLKDGRVLLAGGWFQSGPAQNDITASAELFDPTTNTFSAVGDLGKARADHAALLLPDGRVLITGGSRLVGGFLEDLDDAEVFDPSSETFSALAGSLVHTRSTHGMVDAGNGTFVLSGGSDMDLRSGRFDLSNETFQAIGSLSGDQIRFGAALATFQSGGVAVAGGDERGTVMYISPSGLVQNTGSGLNRPRAYATATRIKPDQVLVAGGIDFSQGAFLDGTCDVIIEGGLGGSNTFATNVRFPIGMAHHTATVLASGDILYCGGLNEDGSQPNLRVAFLFDVR